MESEGRGHASNLFPGCIYSLRAFSPVTPGEKSDVDCAQRGTTRTWAATEAMDGREQRAGRQQAKSHGADAGGMETLPDRLINAPHFAISRR